VTGAPGAGIAFAAAVLAALAILASYLRSRRGSRHVVSSLVVWHRLAHAAAGTRARARWWRSLATALAVCGLVGAAVSPVGDGATPADDRTLVIDTSLSMHTRTATGETRVARAIRAAAEAIRDRPAGARSRLLDTTGQMPPRGWLTRDDALRTLADFAPVPVDRGANWPVGAGRERALYFTDGVGPQAPDAAVAVLSVFEPADNAGIVSFETVADPVTPSHREAALTLANGSPRAREVEVVLEAGTRRLNRRVRVPAESTHSERFDVSDLPGGVIAARIATAGDALAADDRAFAFLPDAAAREVLIVTSGRPELRMALALLPGVVVRETDPAAFERDGPGGASVVVLDGYEPEVAPAVPVLAFGSPRLAAEVAPMRPGRPEGVRGEDPIVTALAWGDVRVDIAPNWNAGAATLVRAARDERLTLVAETAASPPRVDVAFRLDDSNLAQQGRFPALLAAALTRLEAGTRAATHPTGVVVVGGAGSSRVHDTATGAEVSLFETHRGSAFIADGPGAYLAERAGARAPLIVMPQSSSAAFVNRTILSPGAPPRPAGAFALPSDAWRAGCLALAVVVLVIEAVAFARGRTE